MGKKQGLRGFRYAIIDASGNVNVASMINPPDGAVKVSDRAMRDISNVPKKYWTIRDGRLAEMDLSEKSIVDHQQKEKDREKQYADLLNAAKSYVSEHGEVYPPAVAKVAIEANSGNQKALAMIQWTDTVFADYYMRKAVINADGDFSLDFSNHGEIPYKISELMT